MKKKQLQPHEVDLARAAAVIDFVNETDRALWRAHVMSVHSPQWARERDHAKTSQVGR